jgi:puromycin-sensitive aminopeptidase
MQTQNKASRLIKTFVPSHYDLHISQDSKNLTFSGNVRIDGKIVDLSENIKLHSTGLEIKSVSVNGLEVEYSTDENSSEITIQSNRSDSADVEILVEYEGTITRQMHGLYLSSYIDDSVEKRILTTQFESHHARGAFPCVDEPEAKATFQLHLTTNTKDVCVSNTPIVSEKVDTLDTNTKTVVFDKTPKMSTYLLAWTSGELALQSAESAAKPNISVYSSTTQSGKGLFAVGIAKRCVEFLEDYFGIPYPLAKLDLVAIPDFSAGGMENWGMITFRDSCLLIDEVSSDIADKRYVAEVVAHEIAHQWFGNLVTMTWWDDLWLNEGFASWMSFLILDNLEPEWKVWEQFSAGDMPRGLRADALNTGHPVVLNISNPNEIAEAFDRISYDKGCAVVELLYRFIGPEDFRQGLSNYLKEFSYSSATTADLWRHWSEASRKDVAEFMRVWTEVQGFPLVEVNDTSISQKQFLLSGGESNTIWPIPLIQDGSSSMLESKSIAATQTSKLNIGQSGFYRVLYSGEVSDNINKSIGSGMLAPTDALGVICDASECAKAGYLSSVAVLEQMLMASSYTNEPLLSSILADMSEYRSVFVEQFDTFKPYFAKFITPNYERLGIDQIPGESEEDQLLRPSILAVASYIHDKYFMTYAIEKFSTANSPEDLRPDLRSVIYSTIATKYGSTQAYQKLLNWYATTTLPGEQNTLASALMSFAEPQLIARSLEYCITDGVKLQDVRWWVAAGLRGRLSRHITWEWLKTNWQFFDDNYGSEKDLGLFVKAASLGFASPEHLADYTSFFANHPIPGAEMAYKQGIETIQWQSKWKARDQEPIKNWLNQP